MKYQDYLSQSDAVTHCSLKLLVFKNDTEIGSHSNTLPKFFGNTASFYKLDGEREAFSEFIYKPSQQDEVV